MGAHETKTFMSGNSVAVRLPRSFGFGADQRVVIEQDGTSIKIRPATDPEQIKREWKQLYQDMLAIGAPADGVQERDPFEFADRPGL
jgi:virulence-associated protein VagC